MTDKQCIPVAAFKVDDTKSRISHASNFCCAAYMKNGLIAISVPIKMMIYFVNPGGDTSISNALFCEYRPNAIHAMSNGEIALMLDDPIASDLITIKQNTYSENVYFITTKQVEN